MELVILAALAIFAVSYRNNQTQSVKGTYKYISNEAKSVYDKYAPYSFKEVQAKMKELGKEYSVRDYAIQVVLFAAMASVISYLYFHSIVVTVGYDIAAIAFVPYLSYLRSKRLYSEYIFEQIQVYTTNVIMEFNTTQSFVKSLEGVRDSGILENPVLDDVKTMIDMAYTNGTIDQSIAFFDEKYPYYMVKK